MSEEDALAANSDTAGDDLENAVSAAMRNFWTADIDNFIISGGSFLGFQE
jgi:hypothetical protein